MLIALISLNFSLHFYLFEPLGAVVLGRISETIILYLIVFFSAAVIKDHRY